MFEQTEFMCEHRMHARQFFVGTDSYRGSYLGLATFQSTVNMGGSCLVCLSASDCTPLRSSVLGHGTEHRGSGILQRLLLAVFFVWTHVFGSH
jgi:hypothetical protein